MNTRELKIRMLRGLIRPEYFYIPIHGHEKEPVSITFDVTDDKGEPAYITRLSIYLTVYSYPYWVWDDDDHTEGHMAYTNSSSEMFLFEEDYTWLTDMSDEERNSHRRAVPGDMSTYSNKPYMTDKNGNIIEGVTVYPSSVLCTFSEPMSRVTVHNLPVGTYRVEAAGSSDYSTIRYAPHHWDDIYADTDKPWVPVAESSDGFQLTPGGSLTGNAMYMYGPTEEKPYLSTSAIDIYEIANPFENRIFPIVLTRKPQLRFVLTEIQIPGLSGIEDQLTGTRHDRYDVYLNNDGVIGQSAATVTAYKTPYSLSVSKTFGFKVYEDDEYKGLFFPRPITVRPSANYANDEYFELKVGEYVGIPYYDFTIPDTPENLYEIYGVLIDRLVFGPFTSAASNLYETDVAAHQNITAGVYDEFTFGPYNPEIHNIITTPDDCGAISKLGEFSDDDDEKNKQVFFAYRRYKTEIGIKSVGLSSGIKVYYDRTDTNEAMYRDAIFSNPLDYNGSTTYDINYGGLTNIQHEILQEENNYVLVDSSLFYRVNNAWPNHIPTAVELAAIKPGIKPDDSLNYVNFYYIEGMTKLQVADYLYRAQHDSSEYITVELDI